MQRLEGELPWDDLYVAYEESIEIPTIARLKEQARFEDESSSSTGAGGRSRRRSKPKGKDEQSGGGMSSTCRICHKYPVKKENLTDVLVYVTGLLCSVDC